MNSFKIQMKKN